MADVLVSIPELENFRETVGRSQQEFGNIRESLNSHLQGLRNGDWETKGAREFDMVFKGSEDDIAALEETMQNFVAYLNKKIGQLWDIDNHSVSL
jgi:uncharacterized protein YukE